MFATNPGRPDGGEVDPIDTVNTTRNILNGTIRLVVREGTTLMSTING